MSAIAPEARPFAELEGEAREFFCRASKDMIRGELIAIRVGDDGTVHSDKLDFGTFDERRTRSIEPMKALPVEQKETKGTKGPNTQDP